MEFLLGLALAVSIFLFILIVRFLAIVPDHLASIAKSLQVLSRNDDNSSDDDDGVRMF